MLKRNLKFFLCLLLIADITFSFYQHYQVKLDGDIANISFGYHDLMKDPFGLSVILENKVYGGPNRYFAHWILSTYFKNVPFFFMHFTNPIDSIYLSCAFGKTLIQILILWLLASLINGSTKIWTQKFLIAAVLIAPLFQTAGFNNYMGIISKSVSYTFFYALPLGLLLLFLFPFLRAVIHKKELKFNAWFYFIMFVFAIILSLSGPLVPGTVLIICPLALLGLWKKNFDESSLHSFSQRSIEALKSIPKNYLILFPFISLLSLYSIYIGGNNSENLWHSIPLLTRYLRLPDGLYYLFTQKLGMPLLLILILLNAFIIWKEKYDAERKNILNQLKWIGLFALIYTLLLPLGGYREYRPNIVRGDTFLPVIFCMIYFYGISTYHLLQRPGLKFNSIYIPIVISVLLIFTVADKAITNENDCEKMAIKKLSYSQEKVVFLDSNCTVMCWKIITDPRESELNGKMLQYWGITEDRKLYYQR